METKRVNIFVFDSKENFEKSKKFLATEGRTCKRLILVEDPNQFDSQLSTLQEDDLVFLVVHVFATDRIKGIKEFIASGILDDYPRLQTAYASDGIETEIKHKMVDAGLDPAKIYKYHEIISCLQNGELKPIKKCELKELSDNSTPLALSNKDEISDKTSSTTYKGRTFNYAVLTALYKDEFTELKKFFDFQDGDSIVDRNILFHVGYLKANRSKQIVATTQVSTGMVDASIIATIMLETFRPKYLIMTGVCGGLPEHNFGDIILANKIFTFQKGKVNDLPEIKKADLQDGITTPFIDEKGNPVDLDRIFTIAGHPVSVSVEEFEREPEFSSTLKTALHQKIEHKIADIAKSISDKVNADNFFKIPRTIKIQIAPMACSTMVINKGGYFEKNIKAVDRKISAVEMESYGVARACEFANEGKTIPVIFKAVMDKTVDKSDTYDDFNAKKFAAYTSASFLSQLLELDII